MKWKMNDYFIKIYFNRDFAGYVGEAESCSMSPHGPWMNYREIQWTFFGLTFVWAKGTHHHERWLLKYGRLGSREGTSNES